MKTGIFIDLDGTLVNSLKKISLYDLKVLSALKSNYQIYLVTGKSLVNALPYYQKLKLNTKIITSMGQLISWPNNKDFNNIFVPTNMHSLKKVIVEIKAAIKIDNILLETAREEYYVLNKKKSNMLKLICHDWKKLKLINEGPNQDVIGTYLEVAKMDETTLLKIIKNLNKKYDNWFNFSFWQTYPQKPIIHIKPSHVGKSEAMQTIIKLDELKKTIAFGNGWSDRNMLKKADIGVAMINSTDKVKSFSNLITDFDNNHSGVGKMLIKILKITKI